MAMTDISRRTLLKGTGAALAMGSVSALTFNEWQQQEAHAAENTGNIVQKPSLCNACSNKCGFMATVKDGRLWTLKGLKDHPKSGGHLCGRGHGFAQLAYAEERVTEPLKRRDDGTFEAISWDQAMTEIGEKTKSIIAQYGPTAVSIVNDPRPSGKEYAKYFINSLGSSNIYTHGTSCDLSLASGYTEVIGAASFGADLGNAKMVVYIGRSFADGITPSGVMGIADAAEKGTKIVIVDPRLNSTGVFADQWIPIIPGTDLALLLAVAHVIISEDLYNHTFIEEQTSDFDKWAQVVTEYSPKWAQEITGVSAEVITTLAHDLAAAAPAAVIDASWHAAFGSCYFNSSDTARAVAMVNALLGNYNQKGGALMTGSPSAGAVDKTLFATPAAPKIARNDKKDYPLAQSGRGTALKVLEDAYDGVGHAAFFYNSNAMFGYSNPDAWAEGMKKVDLKVSIEVQMSETAMQCDYVLPECSYLERVELPEWIGGKKWFVGLRSQVLEVIHPNTKPCDEIFNLLMKACGTEDKYLHSAADLGRAQVEALGLNYDSLAEKGILPVDGSKFTYGSAPTWKTTTGKLQFYSAAYEAAGLDPLVRWVPPKIMPKQGEFRLVGGKQNIHSHTMTVNVAPLNAISREYDLERVWINADVAAEYGIKTGDLVEISNELATHQVHAFVTQRVRRECLFIPMHYGGKSPYLTNSYHYGLPINDYISFDTEPGTGANMNQENAVTLKKVNA